MEADVKCWGRTEMGDWKASEKIWLLSRSSSRIIENWPETEGRKDILGRSNSMWIACSWKSKQWGECNSRHSETTHSGFPWNKFQKQLRQKEGCHYKSGILVHRHAVQECLEEFSYTITINLTRKDEPLKSSLLHVLGAVQWERWTLRIVWGQKKLWLGKILTAPKDFQTLIRKKKYKPTM